MIDYYEQLKTLVDKYNLTARDVAFHLGKSEDTAKAYLANPSTSRHRKISEACLEQLEISANRDINSVELLHESFQKVIEEIERLTAQTFGYTKERADDGSCYALRKCADTVAPNDKLMSAKAFYKLIDSLENMYVEFCCHVNTPSYIKHTTSDDCDDDEK